MSVTQEAAKRIWETYSRAWTDVPDRERQALMRETLAEHVTYTGPDTLGRGIEEFAGHIEAFQNQFPGAHFRTRSIIVHNDQSLAEWTMLARDGSSLLTGSSYARFNSQGLIEHLAGFWIAPGN